VQIVFETLVMNGAIKNNLKPTSDATESGWRPKKKGATMNRNNDVYGRTMNPAVRLHLNMPSEHR
jgi:hypothetical protein